MEKLISGIVLTTKRLLKETFKVSPLFILPYLLVIFMKDNSQIIMTLWFIGVLSVVMAFSQIVRKFLFPTFSIEDHMICARDYNNIASAIIVASYFLFMGILCYLVTVFLMASIKVPAF